MKCYARELFSVWLNRRLNIWTLVVGLIATAFPNVIVHAAEFASWPSVEEFEDVITEGTWIHNAYEERAFAQGADQEWWSNQYERGPFHKSRNCYSTQFLQKVELDIREWLVSNYVDHTVGSFNGATSIEMLTVSTWRTYSGISTNGPYTYSDIHSGLCTLQWTRWHVEGTLYDRYAEGVDEGGDTDKAVLNLNSNWQVSSWESTSYGYEGWYVARAEWSYPGYVEAYRMKVLPACEVPTIVPCAIDVYFYVDYTRSDSWHNTIFDDIDDYDMTICTWYFHETWSAVYPPVSSRGGESEATWLGAFDSNPYSISAIDPPYEEYYTRFSVSAVDNIENGAIAKWEFVYE